MTYPRPPWYVFSLSANDCSSAEYQQIPGAVCDPSTGNLSNINYGITQQTSWLQAYGGNVRIDQGVKNQIPLTTASSCPKDATGKAYTIAQGNGGTPGIVISGANTASFAPGGLASSMNWKITSPSGLSFRPANQETLRTGYEFVKTSSRLYGIPLIPLNSLSSCTNFQSCTIPDTIASGTYIAETQGKGLNITSFSLGATSKQVVILVSGSLKISSPIDVPQGSSLAFIVKGSTFISTEVGTLPPPSSCNMSNGDIEGIFSSDSSFIVNGIGKCELGIDRMLNIQGAIITNAALQEGSLLNNRKLCDYSDYPTLTIKERPDIILNLHNLLKVPTYTWQEVAP